MATWVQWRRLFEDGEVKRLTYCYGPDRVLVEHIVDAVRQRVDPHDLDYSSISAGEIKYQDLLAHLNQYPMDPERKRLVVVRDVEKVKKWSGVLDWLANRHMPQVVVVMIDSRPDVDTSQDHIDRIVKSGRLVKCGPLNTDDAANYVKSLGSVPEQVARYLVERTGGDVGVMTDVMRKVSILEGQLTEKVVDILTQPTPATQFVDLLIAMRKQEATEAIERIAVDDTSMIIGALDYQLDALARLNRAMQRQQTTRDVMVQSKVPAFMVKRLLPYARFYDRQRQRACTRVLALIDSSYQDGHRTGLLELLTVLW